MSLHHRVAPRKQPLPAARVLLNALALHSARDAARIFLENLVARLPDVWPEAEIHVLAPDEVEIPSGQVHVIRTRAPRSGLERVAEDFIRLPNAESQIGPDVVISPNESIPSRVRAPLVVVAQNLFFHCPEIGPLRTGPPLARLRSRLQFTFYRRQMPRAYARADVIVAVSRHAATELARYARLDPSRVRIVPYGADRLPVRPRIESGGTRRLLAVGALAHYKRLNVAVVALAALRRGGADYELLLAGEAWPGYRDTVDRFARAAGIGRHVKWLGAVSGEELAELFAGSFALVSLSACESFGIPVVEAMRAGVPVVVADEPWSAETVGDAAVRVVGTDPLSVADGVRSLLDRSEWQRRVEAGRRTAARYTWSGNAAGIAAAAASVARGDSNPLETR
jgi:glycosyltransferase involved in cell wall biosynthesis